MFIRPLTQPPSTPELIWIDLQELHKCAPGKNVCLQNRSALLGDVMSQSELTTILMQNKNSQICSACFNVHNWSDNQKTSLVFVAIKLGYNYITYPYVGLFTYVNLGKKS